MTHQDYQETALKLKFKSFFFKKIIGIGFLLQVFVFAYFFNVNLKNDAEVRAMPLKSIIMKKIKSQPFSYEEKKDYDTLKKHLYKDAFYPFFGSFGMYIFPFLGFYLFGRKMDKSKEKEGKGSKIVNAKEVNKIFEKAPTYLKIGGFDKSSNILIDEDKEALKVDKKKEQANHEAQLLVPTKNEPLHFLIVGRSGTGKTVLLKPLLEQMRFRNDRVLLHDFKGDFTQEFYDKAAGDLILNPFNEDSIRWSIFNEIDNNYDIDSIVSSLIPEPIGNEDPFWKLEARKVLKGAFVYLTIEKKMKNKNMFEFFEQSNEEIKECFESHKETIKYSHLFAGKDSKTAQSVMSVVRQYADIFEMLKNIDGSFCIKEWAKDGLGTIFIQNKPDIKVAMKPLISLFFDLMSKSILAQPDRRDRTFFVLDEFGELQKLSSIIDLLTNGRSKGVSNFICLQEPAQIEKIYGRENKSTIMNNTSNKVIFGLNDADSARDLSNQIGEREEVSSDESINHMTDGDAMNSYNVRKHNQTKNIILAGEIQNLNLSSFSKNILLVQGRTKSGKNRQIAITIGLANEAISYLHTNKRFRDKYSAFKLLIKRLNIKLPKGQLTHVLRHTFASHFVQKGGDILTLQKLLGHSDIKTTMRYAHLAPDYSQKALSFNPLSNLG